MSDMLHFPRSSAVKATQITADILSFNRGRTTYPIAFDNGRDLFIVTGPGVATEIQVGAWVVEHANGVEVHAEADFCQNFCSVAS
jgi:hypothetical protein